MVGGVAPGSSSRGRGGKFKKYTRGGGKHFSRDLQPVDADGNQVSMWSADARKKKENGEEEDESSEEEESSEDDDEDGASKGEATREDRKALKKARKQAAIDKQQGQTVEVGDMPSSDEDSDEDDEDMPANPNHSKAARDQLKVAAQGEDTEEGADGTKGPKTPGSRKERESLEAAAAKEKYMKLHTQGKTDEAKADMVRLKLIREQRDAEAARRQAEKEDRDAQEKARKADADAKEAKKRDAAAGPKKPIKKK